MDNQSVEIGDCIVALENDSIEDAAAKHVKTLAGQPIERQIWNEILLKYKEVTIEKNGTRTRLPLNPIPREARDSIYTYKSINDETSYLAFNDFMDAGQMHSLLSTNKESLNKKNLIIDLRGNGGGFDTVFFPLFDYMFPPNYLLIDYVTQVHNMTTRNYDNRINELRNFIAQDPNNQMLKEYVDIYASKKGLGMTTLTDEPDEMLLKGSKSPEKVILLTDRFCSSSGDMICIHAKKSTKVTQVGRATHGVIDYGNIAYEDLGSDFKLMYSTSMNIWEDNDTGYDHIGVQPDVYVQWTPAHLKTDVDLEKALEILGYKNQ